MEARELFTAALQLSSEWRVEECDLKPEEHQLTLKIGFLKGSKFALPQEGHTLGLPVHDTVEKRWRHLNFFQFRTEIVAKVPRVRTPDGRVVQVEVPWARSGSGFTLLLEAMAMLLAGHLPVSEAAQLLGVEDTRLWRAVEHHVEEAYQAESWKEVRRILIDETSSRKGHRYVTNIIDADSRRLLFMTEGRDSQTLAAFVQEMRRHGAHPEQIELVSMDMSAAYMKGAREHLPRAQIVFDHFHIMVLAGVALDKVRRALAGEGADLKGGLWALRGNQWTRTQAQRTLREALCQKYPKLSRAMALREMLQDILAGEDPEALDWWCSRAMRSRLEPFKDLACTIRRHRAGIINFLQTRLTNGLAEAINGLLQLAKRSARGFRSFKNFRLIGLLKAGRLSLKLPELSPT